MNTLFCFLTHTQLSKLQIHIESQKKKQKNMKKTCDFVILYY